MKAEATPCTRDELEPTARPLPWKAVLIGERWDVTNDAGDPREEYSVLEYATQKEAEFIARACNTHHELLAAIQDLLAAAPAYRNTPVGAENSIARLAQEAHIAAEDRARLAVAKATTVFPW